MLLQVASSSWMRICRTPFSTQSVPRLYFEIPPDSLALSECRLYLLSGRLGCRLAGPLFADSSDPTSLPLVRVLLLLAAPVGTLLSFSRMSAVAALPRRTAILHHAFCRRLNGCLHFRKSVHWLRSAIQFRSMQPSPTLPASPSLGSLALLRALAL